MSYIKTWNERCDEHPDHQSGIVSNGMIQARMQEEIDDLRAEIDRLRSEDTKTRHALKGWVFVCPDGGDEPTHERVSAVVAEVEGLRAQLEDRYVAMRVRQLEEALDAERQTVRRLRATNKQLVTGIDNISRRNREEIERLREALQESACACSSIRECASEWAKDGKCPHLIARVALEGKT